MEFPCTRNLAPFSGYRQPAFQMSNAGNLALLGSIKSAKKYIVPAIPAREKKASTINMIKPVHERHIS